MNKKMLFLIFISCCFLGLFVPYDCNFFEFIISCFLFILCYSLSIFIHESGHLIFGLLSGYHFTSFRIGHMILIKKKDGFKLKQYYLAGTGGQCLLSPPDMKDNTIPYVLYNLGGVIMNGIVFFICFLMTLSMPPRFYSMFPYLLYLTNFISFIVNGIPMEMNGLYNDGLNLKYCHDNKEALYSLWLQLKVNSELSHDKRLKDLPEQWFYFPDDLSHPFVSQIGILYANRLLDSHNFHQTLSVLYSLKKGNISPFFYNMIYCDYLYCSIMTGQDYEDIWNTSQIKQFRKQMKNSLSVIRTEYAYALTHHISSDIYLERFNKQIPLYPYQGEVESEKELIELLSHTN